MATIKAFVIPSFLSSLFTGYDTVKLVNAVQAALNDGIRTKHDLKVTNEYKTVKMEDGSKVLVINKKTKAGETLQCRDSLPARLDAWMDCVIGMQQFGETIPALPDVYVNWLDSKFKVAAKSENETVKAS